MLADDLVLARLTGGDQRLALGRRILRTSRYGPELQPASTESLGLAQMTRDEYVVPAQLQRQRQRDERLRMTRAAGECEEETHC